MYNLFYVNYTFKKLYFRKRKNRAGSLEMTEWKIRDGDCGQTEICIMTRVGREVRKPQKARGSRGWWVACHEGKGLGESKAIKKEKQASRRSEDMATTRGRRQHRQGRQVSVEGVVDEVWNGPWRKKDRGLTPIPLRETEKHQRKPRFLQPRRWKQEAEAVELSLNPRRGLPEGRAQRWRRGRNAEQWWGKHPREDPGRTPSELTGHQAQPALGGHEAHRAPDLAQPGCDAPWGSPGVKCLGSPCSLGKSGLTGRGPGRAIRLRLPKSEQQKLWEMSLRECVHIPGNVSPLGSPGYTQSRDTL